MENIKLYDNIKKLFKSILRKDSNIPAVKEERTSSQEHGFQLMKDDASDYLKHFLPPEILSERIKNLNLLGYLDVETGMYLKSIIDTQEYDTYIKSVHSTQVESIFDEGIRCLGTSSSLATINPDTVQKVSLDNTVTKVDDLTILIESLKKHNGVSQGYNQIDGTIILQVPKGTPKEELLYYNENTKTYNIKPGYNMGFLPVDNNHRIGDWVFPKQIDQNKTM